MEKFIFIPSMLMMLSANVLAGENTNEVTSYINSHVGGSQVIFPQSNTLPQPSRREVAGAVLLNTDLQTEVKLDDEITENK